MVFTWPNSLRSAAKTTKWWRDQRRKSACECCFLLHPLGVERGISPPPSSKFASTPSHCRYVAGLFTWKSRALRMLQKYCRGPGRRFVIFTDVKWWMETSCLNLVFCIAPSKCMPCRRKTNPEVPKRKQAQQQRSQVVSILKILNQRRKRWRFSEKKRKMIQLFSNEIVTRTTDVPQSDVL